MRQFLQKSYNSIRLPTVVLLLFVILFSGGCDTGNTNQSAVRSPVAKTVQRNSSKVAPSVPRTAQSLTPKTADSNITQRSIQPRSPTVIDKRLAALALEIASSAIKLTTELQATIDYEELSRRWSYSQVLNYVYQNDPQFREMFSPLSVEITPNDFGIIVRIYTRDRTVILIEDSSETSWIDWRYGA